MRNIKQIISAVKIESWITGFVIVIIFFIPSCKKNVSSIADTKFKVSHSSANLNGFKAVHLSGGGYAVAAHDPRSNSKCHLLGFAEDGTKLWEQQFPDSITMVDIAATNDNGVIICGYNNGNAIITQQTIYVKRFSASGNPDWANSFIADAVYYLCMAIAPDGSVFLNSCPGITGLHPCNFLYKLSSGGQLLSSTQATGMTPDSLLCFPLSMAFSGSNIIVTGALSYWADTNHTTVALSGPFGDFCFCMDTGANVKWFLHQLDTFAVGQSLAIGNGGIIADAGSSSPFLISQSISGNFFLTSDRGNVFEDVQDNIMVRLFDPATGAMQVRQIALPDAAQYPCIAATADGGYIIAATDNLSSFDNKILVAKTSNNLDVQWTKQFNIPNTTSPFGIFQAADNGYVIFAGTQSFGAHKDIAFIKTDPNGNIKQ